MIKKFSVSSIFPQCQTLFPFLGNIRKYSVFTLGYERSFRQILILAIDLISEKNHIFKNTQIFIGFLFYVAYKYHILDKRYNNHFINDKSYVFFKIGGPFRLCEKYVILI